MIKIKCGTCGTSQGYKTESDGELTLPAAEEKRLVDRGVAKYVTRPIISPDNGVATPPVEDGVAGMGTNTPGEKKEAGGPMTISAGALPGTADGLDIVDGHFTEESLSALKNAELKALAIDLGLDPGKCGNKAEFVALLLPVEIIDEDDGDAPSLGSGDNIVQ